MSFPITLGKTSDQNACGDFRERMASVFFALSTSLTAPAAQRVRLFRSLREARDADVGEAKIAANLTWRGVHVHVGMCSPDKPHMTHSKMGVCRAGLGLLLLTAHSPIGP